MATLKGRGPMLVGWVFILGSSAGLLLLPLRSLWAHWEMRSWVPAPGRLLSVGTQATTVESRPGIESQGAVRTRVYRLTADYTYTYAGRTYRGARVDRSVGFDSLSDQDEILDSLEQKRQADGKVTVWVNPRRPEQAVLVRDLRWKLVLVQSAVMLAMLCAGWLMVRLG